jgi:hypothetical protein
LHPELVLAGGQRPVAELAAEVLCLLEQAGKIRAV